MPLGALVLASFTLLAQIGAAPEPVTVRFDAPAECPGEREFFDELRVRTPHVRRAREGEPSRVLRVWVERNAERSVGRIVIEDQGTASAARVVSAPTCSEAVKALALVAAISIDPSAAAPARTEDTGASLEPEASATEASPDPEPKEPGAPPAPRERPGEPRAIERPGEPRAIERAAEPRAIERARGPSALRFGGGFVLDAVGVAAPGARMAPRVFAELVVDRPALFAPSLRLSGTRFTSTELSIPGASASFIWSIVRLDGCPIALRPAPQIVLRPCAAFDAGTLHAEGIGGVSTQSRLRPWAAVAALARAEWDAIGPLVLSAELGAALPLVREDFFFAPDAQPGGTIYAAPAIAAEGGAGLAVRFPCSRLPDRSISRRTVQSASRMALPLDQEDAPDADARMRAMVADHFDFVWRTTRRFGLRDFEADDATQRAFIVASRRLDEIERGRERSFLFAAAMRIASEIRRTHARRAEVLDDEKRLDPAPLQDELVDRRRARALLDEVIEAMSDDMRVVFVLFELEQMTLAEIAALVRVPQGTVASRLRRARSIFERKIALAQKKRMGP